MERTTVRLAIYLGYLLLLACCETNEKGKKSVAMATPAPIEVVVTCMLHQQLLFYFGLRAKVGWDNREPGRPATTRG